MPSRRAAAEKLPPSTTSVNSRMPEKVSIATHHLCVHCTDLRLAGWIIQADAKAYLDG
jgi:hypothetical protein